MKFNKLLYFAVLAWLAPAQAVPDQEPEVTAQVAALLEGMLDGAAVQEKFTERGRTYLAPPNPARALQACPRPLPLELLTRNVNGEDRLYVYRARCRPVAVRIAIDFNKAALVNRLEIAEER